MLLLVFQNIFNLLNWLLVCRLYSRQLSDSGSLKKGRRDEVGRSSAGWCTLISCSHAMCSLELPSVITLGVVCHSQRTPTHTPQPHELLEECVISVICMLVCRHSRSLSAQVKPKHLNVTPPRTSLAWDGPVCVCVCACVRVCVCCLVIVAVVERTCHNKYFRLFWLCCLTAEASRLKQVNIKSETLFNTDHVTKK